MMNGRPQLPSAHALAPLPSCIGSYSVSSLIKNFRYHQHWYNEHERQQGAGGKTYMELEDLAEIGKHLVTCLCRDELLLQHLVRAPDQNLQFLNI